MRSRQVGAPRPHGSTVARTVVLLTSIALVVLTLGIARPLTKAAAVAPPPCAGVWTTVVLDTGEVRNACVAQDALVPAIRTVTPSQVTPSQVTPTPATSTVTSTRGSGGSLPSTGSRTVVGMIVGAVLVAAGAVASLISRRRH